MIVSRKILKFCLVLVIAFAIFHVLFISVNNSKFYELEPRSFGDEKNVKVLWEDPEWVGYELTRVGPGEHGVAYIENDTALIAKNEEWLKNEGFYVEVSNKISFTRALPDNRPQVCQTKKYFKQLPNVSVIVVFHNEIVSTLLRCVHSIYNRSPKELLHEIVLINDKSTFAELYDALRVYVTRVFGDKVKLYENAERQGLIKARMTGARKATGEIIIFLDSHMEVYNFWLPPLLDTLVTHPNAAVIPVCDGMDAKTFKPSFIGYGYRGMFDWNFRYQWFPLRKQDRLVEGEPYELPCMTGGSYAIRRDLFFHLGGYDEGLLIWNGENYEMCIKLWLCSGGLFEAPCSRVAHLSKHHSAYRSTNEVSDFIGRNLKRVAEVWLDDYKQHFYKGNPKRFANIDAGDLTEQFKKKKELGCKPFSHYLEVVAPDMLLRYPPTPQHFAAGTIRSISDKRCVTMNLYKNPIYLDSCYKSGANKFFLTPERSIRYNDTNDQCLQSDKLNFGNCRHQFGTEYWKFDLESRQILSPKFSKCLTANSTDGSISMQACDMYVDEQKWAWTFENKTALNNWDAAGVPVNPGD